MSAFFVGNKNYLVFTKVKEKTDANDDADVVVVGDVDVVVFL